MFALVSSDQQNIIPVTSIQLYVWQTQQINSTEAGYYIMVQTLDVDRGKALQVEK